MKSKSVNSGKVVGRLGSVAMLVLLCSSSVSAGAISGANRVHGTRGRECPAELRSQQGISDQDANDGLESIGFLPGPFGGPGEVPTPFEVNQRVELADGEEYLLSGRLMSQRSGRVVFRVDLQQQSWLASRRRIRSPFYVVDSSPIEIRKFVDSDQTIRMKVQARSVIVGSCGAAAIQIRVVPVSEPVPATTPLSPEEIRYRGPRS